MASLQLVSNPSASLDILQAAGHHVDMYMAEDKAYPELAERLSVASSCEYEQYHGWCPVLQRPLLNSVLSRIQNFPIQKLDQHLTSKQTVCLQRFKYVLN